MLCLFLWKYSWISHLNKSFSGIWNKVFKSFTIKDKKLIWMFWSKPPTTILWQMDRSLEWSGGVSFNEKFNNQKEEKFLSSKHFMHLWNIWKSFDSFSSIFSLNPDLLVVPRRTILHLCCDCCDCSLSCPACQASGPTLDQSQTLLDMSEPSASTLHWLIDWHLDLWIKL